MHISEGILSVPVLATGAAITVIGTSIGLKQLDGDKIMTTALLTATFFVASLIHVPLGPASIHLVLSGLMGITLGWMCFPAILVALFLQMLFFQYGGLTSLGTNTANMALPAILCFYLFRSLLISDKAHSLRQNLAGFLSGFVAILLGTIFICLSLGLSDKGYWAAAQLTFVSYLPLMVIEGFITLFAVNFLLKVQPEFLYRKKQ